MIRRQRPRYGRVHLRRRHRHPRQMIMDEAQRVAGTERRRTRRQLVQRRTQRVQVRPLVHRPAGPPGLLRRQIRQRPDDLGVVGELRAELGQRRRQREVHQARGAVPESTTLAGLMSRCITPRRCIPATARASSTASPISSSTASGFASPARLAVADIRQHDRVRIPRRRPPAARPPSTPRSRSRIASSCRSRLLRVRPQRLLADHRAPGKEQPSHPRRVASVDRFRPLGAVTVRQPPACPHPYLHER